MKLLVSMTMIMMTGLSSFHGFVHAFHCSGGSTATSRGIRSTLAATSTIAAAGKHMYRHLGQNSHHRIVLIKAISSGYFNQSWLSSSSSSSSRSIRGCAFSSSSTHTALFATANDENKDKARILFLGTPDVAATSLQRLVSESQNESCPFEIVGVVTQPPKRRQRRGKEVPSPVGIVAQECNLPVLCPEKAKDDDFLTELEQTYKPDLCITAAYGQYLPKRFLKIPKFGTLNIHPSLLPRWRGASPVQRSLEAGDNPVGVTVLFTVSKMDAGPIVTQQSLEIDDNDNATKLLPLLFEIGTDMLVNVLPDVIQGKITMDTATPQNEDEVINADMIDSSEGELFVWRDSAKMCHDKIRGFSMWPGTFLHVKIGDDNGNGSNDNHSHDNNNNNNNNNNNGTQ
jgi:methionyl-tRNA formyltransferase